MVQVARNENADRWRFHALTLALVAVWLGEGCSLLGGVDDCGAPRSRCGATPGTRQECDGGEGYYYWGEEQKCLGLAPVCVGDGTCDDQPNAAVCSTEMRSPLAARSGDWSPNNAADFDGDGLVDILFISSGNELFLARGTGGGVFSEGTNIPVPSGKLVGVRPADVNGDHHLDLVLSFDWDELRTTPGAQPPSLHVLTGKGDGTFAEARAYAVAAPLMLVGASDLDADGRDEILATAKGSLQILSRLTDPEFETQTVDVPIANIASVQVAQVVRGGPPALVAWTETGDSFGNVLVLVPNTTGGYDPGMTIERAAAVADVDNDGLADVIVASYVGSQDGMTLNEQSFSVELSSGDGTFHEWKSTTVPASSQFITAADVDGDHNVDLVMLYSGKFLTIFKGHGDGTFESPVPFVTDASLTAPTRTLVADLDNDGRTDIAAPSASLGQPDPEQRQLLFVMSGACVGK